MCLLHRWKFIGEVHAWSWVAGVQGGIKDFKIIYAIQCLKCRKVKEA